MCIYMYTYICIYTYVCVYIYMYLCVYVYKFAYVYTYTYRDMYVCTYVCVCMFIIQKYICRGGSCCGPIAYSLIKNPCTSGWPPGSRRCPSWKAFLRALIPTLPPTSAPGLIQGLQSLEKKENQHSIVPGPYSTFRVDCRSLDGFEY